MSGGITFDLGWLVVEGCCQHLNNASFRVEKARDDHFPLSLFEAGQSSQNLSTSQTTTAVVTTGPSHHLQLFNLFDGASALIVGLFSETSKLDDGEISASSWSNMG